MFTAVDFICETQEAHPDVKGLTFVVMDVRNLELEEGSVDVVVEKCVMDCFACDPDAAGDSVAQMLAEASRVLKCGGAYICVSLNDAQTVLTRLEQANVQWGNIEVVYDGHSELLSAPELEQAEGSAAEQAEDSAPATLTESSTEMNVSLEGEAGELDDDSGSDMGSEEEYMNPFSIVRCIR